MSAVWTITKGATALSLLADPYYLADELPLGTVPRSFDILTGPTVDLPQIANYRTSDVRVLPWRCEVYGDDGQDLEDNLNALFDVLPGAGETATITIGRTDGTATAELELLAVSDLEAPYTYRRDMGRAALVSCRLVCAPYATSATDTLYSASAVSLPCVLDLSAMQGQHEAPLELVLNATDEDLHQIVAGVYPEAAELSKFFIRAVDLTWSGGAATTEAAGFPSGLGGTVWATNSATAIYADIDDTDFEGGTYAVFANVKKDAGADPAQVYTEFGDEVTIEGTTLRRQFLGFVSLPCDAVRGSATSSLRVYLVSDGTDYVYANTFEIIPASWGFVGWHHATSSESADELRWDDELVYADDVASLAHQAEGSDRQLRPLGGTLVVTGEAETAAPTLDVTAGAEYAPRWEQLPSEAVLATLRDFVRAGYAELIMPTSVGGWERYGKDELDFDDSYSSWPTLTTGRQFVPGTSNDFQNPNLIDSDSDGIPDSVVITNTCAGTPTYTVNADGSWRVQYTGEAGDDGTKALVLDLGPTAVGSYAEGDPCTFGVVVEAVALTGVTATLYAAPRTAADGAAGYPTGQGANVEPLPVWHSVSITCPATTSRIRGRVYFSNIGNGDVIDVTIRRPQVEKYAGNTPFFCGDDFDANWSNDKDADPSVRPAADLVLPVSAGGTTFAPDDEGTIAFALAPWWHGNDGLAHQLFSARDAGDSADSLLIYKHTDNTVVFGLYGAGSKTVASAALAAGRNTRRVIVARWVNGDETGPVVDLAVDGTSAAQVVNDQTVTIGSLKPGQGASSYALALLGPYVHCATYKGPAWVTAATIAALDDPVTFFETMMDVGDAYWPFGTDSVGFLKIAPPGPLPLVIFDGDSLTLGAAVAAADRYPTQVASLLPMDYENFGVGSQRIDQMSADAATQIDVLYDADAAENVVVCWAGINDIALGDSSATVISEIAAYCAARRAAGFKVVVCTITPCTVNSVVSGKEDIRIAVNASIRTNWATYADALADIGGDSRIGDKGDEDDTTYYDGDKTHFNAAGYAVVASIVKPAIAGLL